MDNVGYLAYSQAAKIGRAVDVTANNIANANTNGFRGSRVTFDSLIADTGTGDQMSEMAYSIDRGTYNDLTEGALVETGNPLDVAIQGDAFFAYERTDGRLAIGRDGNLSRTPEGELVTASGHRILNNGGAPINIPADSGPVSISLDGTVSTALNGVIDQIGAFAEPDAAFWQKLDGGMLAPREGDPALIPALDVAIRQGFSEGSNVNPILEMSNMIKQQRAYERAMGFADTANELRSQALQRLGRSA